jgi:site-specific DNA-methyltransferase (adenine-specific)
MTTHTINRVTIHEGDCLQSLRTMPDESVHCVVTDPPYGLSFMGKRWDYDVPAVAVWQECLRVLKPGGHLLAFAGTRTQHRMAVRIEDAGFEIRDMIAWVYGSGFSKSMDVTKAIDAQDAVQEQQARRLRFTAWMRSTGISRKQVTEVLQESGLITQNGTMAGHYFAVSAEGQPSIMTREHLEACRHLLGDIPEWVERECDIRSVESQTLKSREVIGQKSGTQHADGRKSCFDVAAKMVKVEIPITAPATEAAKQWQGWGTSVRPALEPITWARKPLIGTVAENLLQHGTGAVNVDGCKVDGERLPANFIHDGSGEACDLLGDAARFFYCAKADSSERRNSKHPTIKPLALMRYLCRLVCPPDGIVLDPFCGSGTTLEAARLEGFGAIGCELNPEYIADCKERLKQGVLF